MKKVTAGSVTLLHCYGISQVNKEYEIYRNVSLAMFPSSSTSLRTTTLVQHACKHPSTKLQHAIVSWVTFGSLDATHSQRKPKGK